MKGEGEPMPTFGKARLCRSDIGLMHKLQFRVCGVGDPGHFLRSRYFRKFVRGLQPKSVLDAGSGGGDYSFWMAERWPEAKIESVDICEELVVRNRQLQEALGIENIRFVTMDLVELPKGARYDLIVSIDSLEHIVEQGKVLNNFYSALRPGGWLYLH